MPICERDPWRDQYFENIPCPDNVLIPTDDFDAWPWYPKHNWIYDKLRMAQSQGFACGPHGVMPACLPGLFQTHHQPERHGRGQPRDCLAEGNARLLNPRPFLDAPARRPPCLNRLRHREAAR